jgi:hypothetical protein
MDVQAQEKLIAGYRELAKFLTDEGFRTSPSTCAKYCSPAINIGPPSEGVWGRLPTFRPSRVREWAHDRMRRARTINTAA